MAGPAGSIAPSSARSTAQLSIEADRADHELDVTCLRIQERQAAALERARHGERSGSLARLLLECGRWRAFLESFTPGAQHQTRLHVGAFGTAAYNSPWAVDARNRVHQCTFLPGDSKAYFRPYVLGANGVNNTILYDTSGCVIPAGGALGVLFPLNNTVLAQGLEHISVTPTANVSMNVNYFANGTQPFGQAIIFCDSTGTNVNATMQYAAGTETVTAIQGSWWMYPWNIPVPVAAPPISRVNTITRGSTPFSGKIVMMLADCAQNSVADFAIPYTAAGIKGAQWSNKLADAADFSVYNPTKQTTLTSNGGPFGNLNTTAYWYDSAAHVLHIRIKLDLSGEAIATGTLASYPTFSGANKYVCVFGD